MDIHPHETDQPMLVSLPLAARRIGIAPATIRRHADDFFPIHKLGAHRYVLSVDLARWIFERHAEGLLRHGRAARA
jgi:hypothetical protein